MSRRGAGWCLLLALSAVVLAPRDASAGDAQTGAQSRVLETDTALHSAAGTQFRAPAGWTLEQLPAAQRLLPPEQPDAWVAMSDVSAADADAALAQAWQSLSRQPDGRMLLASDLAKRDGWSQIRNYRYETPPAENRLLTANVYGRGGGGWTVFIAHLPLAVADQRRGQIAVINERILPPGYERESFAGRTARPLGQREVAQLNDFLAQAREQLDIPGIALGLIQNGKVIYAGGQGVRALGQSQPVDADTRFLVASNTKAMTTMMLARLVDAGTLDWDTPVAQLWPDFQLGNPRITAQVRVKHLLCACTGLPRQDYEWLLQYQGVDAQRIVKGLATLVPTTEFGTLYQYSNQLAAAGGYLGGHLAHPQQELGQAYDAAMQSLVFDPLGMRDTTFDFARAQAGNVAQPHSADVHNHVARVTVDLNRAIVPMRPAGGAWSTVNDMLRFVDTELRLGRLPDGQRYVSEAALLARRAPQVALGSEASYGMGLSMESRWGVRSVQHGGSMIGYQTGMLWLPDHDVGIVLLTNADNGSVLMPLMRRRLLEVLFDGQPLAAADLQAAATRVNRAAAAERADLMIPASADTARLQGRYYNAQLGELRISRQGTATLVDFGEWRSEVASRRHADGSQGLVTLAPGALGYELVIEGDANTPRLVMLDAQHRYVFERGDPPLTRTP